MERETMSIYTPKKLRPLKLLAAMLRRLGNLLRLWPLALIVWVALSPITPHLRLTYSYIERGYTRHFIECEYLGVRGRIRTMIGDACPVIAMIDRKAKQ